MVHTTSYSVGLSPPDYDSLYPARPVNPAPNCLDLIHEFDVGMERIQGWRIGQEDW
jgi:hypothetical protein